MDFSLEDAPTNWQRSRLNDFLVELMLLSRKHKILLHQDGTDLRFVDVEAQTIIGVDLTVLADPETAVIYEYMADNSISDSSWIDGESGLIEIADPTSS